MKKTNIKEMPFFYDRYIDLVSENETVLEALSSSQNILEELKESLIQQQDYQYQEGKWTPKDILQHLIDTERIMSYRALTLARGEQQELIGFEEQKYAQHTNAGSRSVEDLLQEFSLVRKSTLALFKSFSDEMLLREGICSGIHVSPLIFGCICVGHVQHHVNVLHERYFTK
ncbi:DinB family protein [Wenyingzhuangia sp. chi5]|uniref:DinB family protein n=1 Tax=Wenyingzhuangia gilva TaxID=3057677 RepID=A0ABT8VN11_9FLAO|nr:DinB family protein [Wenyingzhuangia sp. chi5]MDO3693347.1 DinB family protein [Wenyingzhuangia sp. chi5]